MQSVVPLYKGEQKHKPSLCYAVIRGKDNQSASCKEQANIHQVAKAFTTEFI